MNIFQKTALRMMKPLFKRIAKSTLHSPETKEWFVREVNIKIDIPKISEDEEAVVYGKVWDLVRDTVDVVIDRI